MKVLYRSGLWNKIGLENFCAHIDEALDICRGGTGDPEHAPGPSVE